MTRSPIKWFEAGKAEGRLEGETIEIKKKIPIVFYKSSLSVHRYKKKNVTEIHTRQLPGV